MAEAPNIDEIWKPVDAYEGIYEVSNLGRVRSLDRDSPSRIYGRPITKRLKGRVLKHFFDKDRYHQVRLCNGRGRSESVHRIVCRAFHGPKPTPDHEVAHNNGDKADNRAANLRWATNKENQRDREKHGTVRCGEDAPWAKLTREQALDIKRRANSGESSGVIGPEYGIDPTYVRQIATGRRWACLET